MKKFLFGCAIALCGLSAPQASAQDYCCPPQCDPCCCGESNFNGFYLGGNIGVFSHTAHRSDLDAALTDNSGWTTNATSFTAGLQLGYDWQWCNKLVGLVGDWNWVNPRHRLRNAPNTLADSTIRSRENWFSTIRARAGLTVCDALVYVTAGAAVSRFHTRWTDTTIGTFNFRDTRWGWTGGVGTEFILGCNWSLGLEVLFLHFDDHTNSNTNTAGTRFNFGHSDSSWLGRLTLNYRFGDLCSCF